jgi:hypothetical protein
LLPRGKAQGEHYRAERLAESASSIRPLAPISRPIATCSSVPRNHDARNGGVRRAHHLRHQDELLDVDKYLLKLGAFRTNRG